MEARGSRTQLSPVGQRSPRWQGAACPGWHSPAVSGTQQGLAHRSTPRAKAKVCLLRWLVRGDPHFWRMARHLTIHSLQSLKASTGLGRFTLSSRLCLGVTAGVLADSSSIHFTSALKTTEETDLNKSQQNTLRQGKILASQRGDLSLRLTLPREDLASN